MSAFRKVFIALFVATIVGAGVGYAASLDVQTQQMAIDGSPVSVPNSGATVSQTAVGGTVNTPHTTTATIDSGTPTFTGTLTFTLFPGAGCTGTPIAPAETISVSGNDGASFTSSAVTPTAVATYYWHASYSGDAVNTPGTSCVSINVTAASSSTSISQVAAGGTAGTAHTSTATLSGGLASATGTIQFTLSTGNACTGTVIGTSSSTVTAANGAQYTSASQTPPSAGTYSWRAVYSGDANHAGATSCVSITVAAAPKLRLASITLTGGTRSGNSDNWQAQLSVMVVDANGAAVSGVTVAGSWTAPNVLANGCTPTSAAGTCSFLGDFNGNGNNGTPRTWTVTGLSKAGYVYDSAGNTVNKITCSRVETSNNAPSTCMAATL